MKKKKREKQIRGRGKEQMTFRRDSTELAIEGESNNRRGERVEEGGKREGGICLESRSYGISNLFSLSA